MTSRTDKIMALADEVRLAQEHATVWERADLQAEGWSDKEATQKRKEIYSRLGAANAALRAAVQKLEDENTKLREWREVGALCEQDGCSYQEANERAEKAEWAAVAQKARAEFYERRHREVKAELARLTPTEEEKARASDAIARHPHTHVAALLRKFVLREQA